MAGDGRAAALAECDDTGSVVRERGDGSGRAADRDGRGPVQDHEGMWAGGRQL